MSDKFWLTTKLEDMSSAQWESLCDSCGKCCLEKFSYYGEEKVHTTKVCCQLFDPKTCQCTKYTERFKYVNDCIKLTSSNVKQLKWLPKTCSYRLVAEGKDLPNWHPLITGDPKSTMKTGNSVKEFVVHPRFVNKDLFHYKLKKSI